MKGIGVLKQMLEVQADLRPAASSVKSQLDELAELDVKFKIDTKG